VLDILIVALIVYKVLDFIRETRVQQLVKGIFVLVVAFLISDVLHLYTLNWILRGTMTGVLIVIEREVSLGNIADTGTVID
ncbi:hypothetical protein FO509_29340, partial [Priestia megaterium]|nr:hypothetical protein [Priestia megaterium]